jgi:hypothetical protein
VEVKSEGKEIMNDYRILIDTDIEMEADGAAAYSDPICLDGAKTLSIQSIFDKTLVADGSIVYQKSNNISSESNWSNLASPTAISADGEKWLEVVDPDYCYIRIVYSVSAGNITSHNHIIVRGGKL